MDDPFFDPCRKISYPIQSERASKPYSRLLLRLLNLRGSDLFFPRFDVFMKLRGVRVGNGPLGISVEVWECGGTLDTAMNVGTRLRKWALLAVFVCFWACMNGGAQAAEIKQLRLGYCPNLTHAQALYARANGEFEKAI